MFQTINFHKTEKLIKFTNFVRKFSTFQVDIKKKYFFLFMQYLEFSHLHM